MSAPWGNTYVLLLFALACYNSVYSMKEQTSKIVHLMALPVVYSMNKVL